MLPDRRVVPGDMIELVPDVLLPKPGGDMMLLLDILEDLEKRLE